MQELRLQDLIMAQGFQEKESKDKPEAETFLECPETSYVYSFLQPGTSQASSLGGNTPSLADDINEVLKDYHEKMLLKERDFHLSQMPFLTKGSDIAGGQVVRLKDGSIVQFKRFKRPTWETHSY